MSPFFLSEIIGNQKRVNNNPTTGYESYIYAFNMLRMKQVGKNIIQFQSKIKILLTVFVNNRGVVQHEFLLEGGTVNNEYYSKYFHSKFSHGL